MKKAALYGAVLERGRVTEVQEDRYRIVSLDRRGITTPPLPALQGTQVQAGDTVLFCMFDDGSGMVIAAMR